MRQLLLLRHAKSPSGDASLGDHARPLNAQGRAAAARMRIAMQGLGITPDVVLVSSARRTLQTLDALGPWDETPLIEPMNRLYLASASQILDIINGVTETVRSLMVLGHNPGLHELAMMLAGGQSPQSNRHTAALMEAFPTASLAEFTVSASWSRLTGSASDAKLVRFIKASDLQERPD